MLLRLSSIVNTLCVFFLMTSSAYAQEDNMSYLRSSSNMMGELGLNTIPSARMSPAGHTRLTISRYADYSQAILGFQLTDRLAINLRQTSESKSFNSDSLTLYPGVDVKWQLYPETRFIPQISVGLQSAIGHRRMSAEYLALSKRYENLDFTFGFGWGRLASQWSIPNPILVNHLDKTDKRDIDGEDSQTPKNWFQGDMALFAGIQYDTQINGLSLKADWHADGWQAEERVQPDFKSPAVWSLGFSYQPIDWMDIGLSYSGQNNIMARISFDNSFTNWPYRDSLSKNPVKLKHSDKNANIIKENKDITKLFNLSRVVANDRFISAHLNLLDNIPSSEQIGNATRYLINNAPAQIQEIRISLYKNGLRGQTIALNRSDIEAAEINHRGSPEEIWLSSKFIPTPQQPFISALKDSAKHQTKEFFKLNLMTNLSLSENDSGILYRTGLIIDYQENIGKHFISFQSLRLNLKDNISNLSELRGYNDRPIRSDIGLYTQNRVSLEKSYFLGLVTPFPDFHTGIAFGYLEEMYAGFNSEILYRPWGKNWAVGTDISLVTKRDSLTVSGLGLTADRVLTGFINGYYEVPETGVTVKASLGRFLDGDNGGQIAISNQFNNGVLLSAFLSASQQQDRDIFGGTTKIHSGLTLSVPLGSLKYIPDGSRIVTDISPLGRDKAQRLDTPTNLYTRSEAISEREITRHWSKIVSDQP